MNNDITNVVTKLLNNLKKKKNNGKYQNIILGYKKQANKPFH